MAPEPRLRETESNHGLPKSLSTVRQEEVTQGQRRRLAKGSGVKMREDRKNI